MKRYKKPHLTLTKEKFDELTKYYEKVENIKDVKLYTHVMYYNVNDDGYITKYNYGGYIIQINDEYLKMSNKPIQLSITHSNNRVSNYKMWTTQIKNNILQAKKQSGKLKFLYILS